MGRLAFDVLSQTPYRKMQDQILTAVNMHLQCVGVCAEKERKTCGFCRLSPVNCNSKTSGPRGYFFLSL